MSFRRFPPIDFNRADTGNGSAFLSIALYGPQNDHCLTVDRSAAARVDRLRVNCRNQTAEVLSVLRAWAPKLMPFSPFIACSVIGPHAIHVKNCLSPSSQEHLAEDGALPRGIDILRLCLKRHAWYWELGTLLLGSYSPRLSDRGVNFFRDANLFCPGIRGGPNQRKALCPRGRKFLLERQRKGDNTAHSIARTRSHDFSMRVRIEVPEKHCKMGTGPLVKIIRSMLVLRRGIGFSSISICRDCTGITSKCLCNQRDGISEGASKRNICCLACLPAAALMPGTEGLTRLPEREFWVPLPTEDVKREPLDS